MYAIKTLAYNRMRFVLTVFGISLCTILMLLLLSIYKGVADGSVEYIKSSTADLWVLQRHSNNILRSNSYLTVKLGKAIAKIEGVKSVSPVFFLLVNINLQETSPTIYLSGYDSKTSNGAPPLICKGRNVLTRKEIVLDYSFARKYNIKIGDKLPLKKDSLVVTGFSKGTNMFVIQYAFVDLEEAWSIAGIKDYVSCYQVKLHPGANGNSVAEKIQKKMGNTVVFDQVTFLKNNIKEMESGILPLLFVVALISSIVLTAVLSLILTINVLERRDEYAIIKALGSPKRFVSGLVVKQALILVSAGLIAGIILFFPFASIVELISPEVSVRISFIHIIVIAAIIEFLGVVSSTLPILRLRNIYPLEAFN